MPSNTSLNLSLTDIPPKTLVIGANGYLGRQLFLEYSKFYPELVGTTHAQSDHKHISLDLENPDIELVDIDLRDYTQAVICAGVTDILQCERNPDYSYALNVTGQLCLVKQLHKQNIKPIVFSSDMIFNGEEMEYFEHSTPNPLNEYGKQKAIIENEIPNICGENYLIVRLSKIYSVRDYDDTFIYKILKNLSDGISVQAVDDITFKPLLIDNFVQAFIKLQTSGASGLYNLSGPQKLSWYEIAQKIAAAFDYPRHLVHKVKWNFLSQEISRPKCVNLVPHKFLNLFPNFHFQSFDESLKTIKLNLTNRSLCNL